eukprot:COSAG02_NODE_3330_length_6923_cov_14.113277_5_plen_72_part_00
MPCDVTDESHVNKAAAVAASADLTILVIGDGSTASTAQNATPYEREVATVASILTETIWTQLVHRCHSCEP